ncbi:MAG: hypothetical protein HeimC3_50190 [Candidatus Heimdallarchaeota archaeon LC_3]|nr:MAG: hypothetical protein HeimC3_50190 [Candidatus Heimdallarchaeota archaeon LC_3]
MFENRYVIIEILDDDVENLVPLELEYMYYHANLNNYFEFSDNMSALWMNYMKEEVLKDKNQKIYAAKIKKQLIGYIHGKITIRPPIYKITSIGIIGTIYVNEKYRRMKIASKLVNKLMEWFILNKVTHIEHPIASNNLPSLNFWKKLGFEEFMVWVKTEIS